MNCGTRLGLTVLSMCAYGFAQKKDPEMAKIFAASQYVFVETIYGPLETTTLDSRVSPEDRRAVFNVEDAVRSWGRYRLTLNRSDAELVFVVRKGQLLAANIGIKISGVPNPRGGPSQRGTSGEASAEVGPAHDLLVVYAKNPDGSLGGPLWNRTLDHGLDAPGLPLFKKFKDEVEASSKTQTKKTP